MLRVGMVGMGGISHSHTAGWAQVPDAKIVCVCDIRREKADEAAAATGGKAWYDLDEMLDNETIDILDICMPTYMHADVSVKALDRGIHVLTEKPISLKREDVARVYAAAQRNHKNFMVAQVLRFWKEYIVLKDAIDTGRYGKLMSGVMSRLNKIPGWSWDNWMKDPERSGLVPFDVHIHDLDFMIYALGVPTDTRVYRAKNERGDYLNVIYEYPGFFITTEASWYDCPYKFQASFRFQFEKAVLEYKDGSMTIYHQSGEVERLDDDADNSASGLDLPKTNGYANEIMYFADCVRQGKPCDISKPEELETVLKIIEKINEH